MVIIAECQAFLKEYAVGQWFETYRFKDGESYLHPLHRGMLLLRVETGTKRAFYWIYSFNDAIRFSEFVGMKLKAEAHEVILTPRCRMFYDVDLQLDVFQKIELAEHFNDNSMDEVAKQVANIYKEATLMSLEEHGVEPDGFDWMFTLRNRPIDDSRFKVSIHLITNLVLPLETCAAIAADVKRDCFLVNYSLLGLTLDIASLLAEAIDETQYRRHGSLSLPYGTKHTSSGVFTNWIFQDYAIPGQRYTITCEDQFSVQDIDTSAYRLARKAGIAGADANPAFVKEALAHAGSIKDYDARIWDLTTSLLRGSTMFVKRYAPSMCSVCNRVHDKDNTLFLMFNSERGIASWKCTRRMEARAQVFYRRDRQELDNATAKN
jgi:hypothetical protein